jgi:hypothetical protein
VPALPLPEDPDAAAREADELLFIAWARRQDLPTTGDNRAAFMALLLPQLEFGWLN